eukprot:3209563-Pyramimonas_sp.AAC.1
MQEEAQAHPRAPVIPRVMGSDVEAQSRALQGPRAPPRQREPGCSRSPLRWGRAFEVVDRARGDASLGE